MTISETIDQGLHNSEGFEARHIGPRRDDQARMLSLLGYQTMQAFLEDVVPASIRLERPLAMPGALSEEAALTELATIAAGNTVNRSLIGQGYYGTYTPAVILRNVLESPAWYTAYTPYQAEISQGRLEALLNYQTMVADLTGMDIANASMLDEATAAAEAMTLCRRVAKSKSNTFFVHEDCFRQTIDVLNTRAEPLGIDLLIGSDADLASAVVFGALLQYPGASGELRDLEPLIQGLHEQKALAAVASDLLGLMLLKSPGEMGADVVVGSSQRFGVPLGGGGPHAAFMATRDAYKRSLPARLVGSSRDADGKVAHRLALQTREQHIRREKATSNICTAQVLLAVMAGMYAVYHGPQGLRDIATRVHGLFNVLATGLEELGFKIAKTSGFDTLVVEGEERGGEIFRRAQTRGFNLRSLCPSGDEPRSLGIALDETCSEDDVQALWSIFAPQHSLDFAGVAERSESRIPSGLRRDSAVLTHAVFNRYHSETEMLRYLRRLADKDIALDRSMIPLGSCTMKLNATSEMLPVSWPAFANVHPFAPLEQQRGFQRLVEDVEAMLCEVTGYDAVSLQPNAGSQGEYAGLLAIRAYHRARGDVQRDICLIPDSAHGTNPASAQMCGMRVVVVSCDALGNVNLEDLRSKASQHSEQLAALMVTYPSTHGVFEAAIEEVAAVVHEHGGQVYIDGANLNALVGLSKPGFFGGDVSHLNLHKTFCIPHGGGGPGIGPVAVRQHLAAYLPGHGEYLGERQGRAVSAAPWGSASILPISWMYMKMMGGDGLRRASEVANLAANYVAARLQAYYPILYTGDSGRVAHECIVDLRPIKDVSGVGAEDVAKRLIDYGFHAPTMSFPVPGTLMIEPTESEALEELDRFCEAMIAIRGEIAHVEEAHWPLHDNPLVNAPHTAEMLVTEDWAHPYSRETAVYPLPHLRENKYWPPVRRVDNAFGDKNLSCSCAPIADYK